MMSSATSLQPLRYLAAGRVQTRLVDLDHAAVETGEGRIGTLAGFLVDPLEGQLRYLVVESERWLRKISRLVPFSVTTVNPARGTLCVELDDASLDSCPEVDPRAVPELSERDLAVR